MEFKKLGGQDWVDANKINYRDPRLQNEQLKAARSSNPNAAGREVLQRFVGEEMGRRFQNAQLGLEKAAFERMDADRTKRAEIAQGHMDLAGQRVGLERERFETVEKPSFDNWVRQSNRAIRLGKNRLDLDKEEQNYALWGGLANTGLTWLQTNQQRKRLQRENERAEELHAVLMKHYGGK